MKKYLYLSLLVVFIASCVGIDTTEKDNAALVEDYVNAVENLDYNLMETYLSEDYMGYGPSLNDSITKSGAIDSWKKNVAELYEKIEYKKSRNIGVSVDDGPNKGHWVSNWAELEITYKESGETIKIMSNTIYLIKENKISKSFTFYNEADALRQLGYVFINPKNL